MRFKAVAQALPTATAAANRQTPSIECHAQSTYTSSPAGFSAVPLGASSALLYPVSYDTAPTMQDSGLHVAAAHTLAAKTAGALGMQSAVDVADGSGHLLYLLPIDSDHLAQVNEGCLIDAACDQRMLWPADHSVRAPSGRSSNVSSSSRLDAADVMMSDLYQPAVVVQNDTKHMCDNVPYVSAIAPTDLDPPCGFPRLQNGRGASAARALFSLGSLQLQRPMMLDLEAAAAAVKAQMNTETGSSVPAHEAALQAAADRVAAVLFGGRYSGLCAGQGQPDNIF